jgi:ankyrin repeat protein
MRIAHLLLDRGADPDHANQLGMTAMLQLSAAHFKLEQTMQAFEWLLDRGAKLQVANAHGLTPLMYCALRGDRVLAKRMIEKGADPNASDLQHRTALSIAKERGDQELIALLSGVTRH